MKLEGVMVMQAGENETFGTNVARTMVGTKTPDGWEVTKARRLNEKEIELTLTCEV